MQTTASAPIRLLRIDDVRDRTTLGKSTIWNLVAAGKFPRPIKSPFHSRTSVWVEAEIDAFIRERVEAARQACR